MPDYYNTFSSRGSQHHYSCGSGYDGGRDYEGGRQTQEPIPDAPPCMANVGNLPDNTVQGVEFNDAASLSKALEYTGEQFEGRNLHVDVAESSHSNNKGSCGRGGKRMQKPIPDTPPYMTYVGNLSDGTVQGDLEQIFKELRVTDVLLVRDRKTDRFRGYIFVEFKNAASLSKALTCDDDRFRRGNLQVADASHSDNNFGGDRGWRGGCGFDRPRGGRGDFSSGFDRPSSRGSYRGSGCGVQGYHSGGDSGDDRDSYRRGHPSDTIREASPETASQRPRLKLLPRSKKEGREVEDVASQTRRTSIFGCGKPREMRASDVEPLGCSGPNSPSVALEEPKPEQEQ